MRVSRTSEGQILGSVSRSDSAPRDGESPLERAHRCFGREFAEVANGAFDGEPAARMASARADGPRMDAARTDHDRKLAELEAAGVTLTSRSEAYIEARFDAWIEDGKPTARKKVGNMPRDHRSFIQPSYLTEDQLASQRRRVALDADNAEWLRNYKRDQQAEQFRRADEVSAIAVAVEARAAAERAAILGDRAAGQSQASKDMQRRRNMALFEANCNIADRYRMAGVNYSGPTSNELENEVERIIAAGGPRGWK